MQKRLRYFLKYFLSIFFPRIRIQFEGLSLQGRLEDYGFLKSLQRGEREPYMVQLFKRSIAPGQVVADVGGHLGHYTLLAARGVGARGTVHVFEPNPMISPLLLENIKFNGFSERVVLQQAAVGAKLGSVELLIDVYQSDFSSTVSQRSDAVIRKCPVPLLTLDDYFKDKPRPTVIKIDVEGLEPLVLLGMKGIVRKAKEKTEQLIVFIESNHEALTQAGYSHFFLVEKLRELGFQVQVIDEDIAALRGVDLDANPGCFNLYCSLK